MMLGCFGEARDSVQGARDKRGILTRVLAKLPPHIVFLLIGGANAILLAILTPPFQVPDEFQHFFRSYQLSVPEIWGSVQDGLPGSSIPASLPDLVERTWGTPEIWYRPPPIAHPLVETWREFRHPLEPERRKFTEFSTVHYSPLLYLPQTLGVAVGRLSGTSPLALLYLGRLANAVVAVLVIAWSLKVLPMGRSTALAVALLPMAQFEYGSVAPDAMIIAAAFLLAALALRASLRKTRPLIDVLFSSAAAGVICAKVVYAPLLAIGVPEIFRTVNSSMSGKTTRTLLPAQIFVAAFALGFAALWLASTSSTILSLTPAATIATNEAAILAEPQRFAQMLITDIQSNGFIYILEAIGVLGHLDLFLPSYVYVLAAVSLVLACALTGTNDPRLDAVVILWNLCLIASVVLLIQTTLFVVSASQGPFWEIRGVQGRYFLPLGAIAAATFASIKGIPKLKHSAEFAYALLLAIILVDTLSMDATIVMGFHLF